MLILNKKTEKTDKNRGADFTQAEKVLLTELVELNLDTLTSKRMKSLPFTHKASVTSWTP